MAGIGGRRGGGLHFIFNLFHLDEDVKNMKLRYILVTRKVLIVCLVWFAGPGGVETIVEISRNNKCG